MSCADRLVFYPNVSQCMFPTKLEQMCPCAGKDDGYFPHPFDCSKYIRCQFKKEVVFTCKAGLVWNKDVNSCVYRTAGTTCPSDLPSQAWISSFDNIVFRPRKCAEQCADCQYGRAEKTVRDRLGHLLFFFVCRESTKVKTKYCLGTDFLTICSCQDGVFCFLNLSGQGNMKHNVLRSCSLLAADGLGCAPTY